MIGNTHRTVELDSTVRGGGGELRIFCCQPVRYHDCTSIQPVRHAWALKSQFLSTKGFLLSLVAVLFNAGVLFAAQLTSLPVSASTNKTSPMSPRGTWLYRIRHGHFRDGWGWLQTYWQTDSIALGSVALHLPGQQNPSVTSCHKG